MGPQREPNETKGWDGYTSATNKSVINITDTVADLTAFSKCVDPEDNVEDAKFLADLIIKEMEKAVAGNPNLSVEEAFAGCVADNVRCNMNAFGYICAKYPKFKFPNR